MLGSSFVYACSPVSLTVLGAGSLSRVDSRSRRKQHVCREGHSPPPSGFQVGAAVNLLTRFWTRSELSLTTSTSPTLSLCVHSQLVVFPSNLLLGPGRLRPSTRQSFLHQQAVATCSWVLGSLEGGGAGEALLPCSASLLAPLVLRGGAFSAALSLLQRQGIPSGLAQNVFLPRTG